MNGIARLLVRDVLHCLKRGGSSDLRAAGEAHGDGGSRGVGGGVGRCHPVGLVDPLAPAELPMLCWAGVKWRRLIMTSRDDGGREQLFAPFSKKGAGPTVADWTSWNTEEVLSCVHGQTGLVAG